MELPTEPRLSVIDEERVAMMRPGDREMLRLDEQLQRAREKHASA